MSRSGDEPEPIDLTHLNIEASMMCLASKTRTICGKADSPTLSNRTFRYQYLRINCGKADIPKLKYTESNICGKGYSPALSNRHVGTYT